MVTKEKVDTQRIVIHNKESAEKTLASVLGARYAAYRKKWEDSCRCEMVGDYPIHLNFELFYGCNLRCVMCVNSIPADKRDYDAAPDKKIGFETYRGIIDEGVSRGLCAVALNGFNEPLLYPEDLIRQVKYAKEAGVIDIFTITNATLLTPEISRRLVESGLTQLKFSFDAASKETYERIRLGADYEKTIANINNFLEIKKVMKSMLPITRISIVKMKENISEVDAFVADWSKKVDYVTIQEMGNPFWGSGEYEKFEKKARIKTAPFKVCAEPFQRLYIRNNGDILPCCSWYGRETPMGNIYRDSVYDIWNSRRMDIFRRNVNGRFDVMPIACRKCRFSCTDSSSAAL